MFEVASKFYKRKYRMIIYSETVIVLARCIQHHQLFGMNFEKKSRDYWLANWAFPIRQTPTKADGFEHIQIQGVISTDSMYPGCPFCKNSSFFKCTCNKISCWDGHSSQVTCPWCHQTNKISGSIKDLSGTSDV